jgi:uncharacterized protein (TIRG00374 family)
MTARKPPPSIWRWLGMLAVVGLLVFVLRHVDPAEVRRGFARVDLRLLPVLVALVALNFWIRSWRWRYLLKDGRSMSQRSLIEATTIGFMATFILPFRAGEVARPWILTRWEAIRFGPAVASIVTERVLDTLVIIGFFGLAASRIEEAPAWLDTGAKLLGAIAVVGTVLMLLAYFASGFFSRLARKLIDRLLFPACCAKLRTALNQLVDGFLDGLKAITSIRQLLLVIIASLLLWLEMALFYQVGLWTLGIPLGPTAGLMVTVLVALAVAAPGPPGFLGTFQIGCLAALGLFEIDRETGLSYAIVTHLVQAAVIILAGLWMLQARGLTLRGSLGPAAEKE